MIGFALSRSFWLSLVLLAVSGAADMLSIYVRSTLIQVLVPPAMLGRVSAVNQIFIGSSNEIGAFESGVAARLLGAVPSVVFGGLITVGGRAGDRLALPRAGAASSARSDYAAGAERPRHGRPAPSAGRVRPCAPSSRSRTRAGRRALSSRP